MKSFTNPSLFALVVVGLLSSCSRPYATFQKTTPEHFYTKATVTPAETPETPVVATPVPAESAVLPATAVRPTTVNEALDQLEAVASAKAGPSEIHKIQKRTARLRSMMALVETKSSTATTKAPKLNLVQKMVLKSIDKKIQKKMAPEKTMARSLLSIGIVVALIGLLLLLIGGSSAVTGIGYAGLIVGIVLIIASLI